MHLLSRILLVLSLTGLSACMQQTGDESPGQSGPVRDSGTYGASYFEEGMRIARIGEALEESHLDYASALERHHLPGVVYGLVVDDSLVFSGAFGYSNPETGTLATTGTLFRIASMTKSFTAMAILKLRDEGKLALSDPAALYVPGLDQLTYPTRDAPPVTIFNLLTMTAGFPEDNPWGDRFLDITDADLMKMVKEGISFSSVPSLNYEYSNLGYGLLGHIITEVSGVPFQQYITQNILIPLGMEDTSWEYSEIPRDHLAQGYRWEDGRWVIEPLLHDGAFGSMGGLITSVEDFSRYISFHLSAWPPRSDPPDDGPVRRSTLREMHQLNNPRYLKDSKRFGNDSMPLIQGYGFGLRGIRDSDGVLEIGHGGGLPGFGSNFMFFPQMGIGIMAFSNLTYAGGILIETNYQVIQTLIDQDLFNPRTLPVSDILEKRKEQVMRLIQSWDPELEKEIVAANLYLDLDRDIRMKDAGDKLNRMGEIVSVGSVIPENQLRGSFIIRGTEQRLRVSFTLSPEAEPKVQWLRLELIP